MAPGSVRDWLPRVGAHFFGRFDGLREVQTRAIPVIMGGSDVLVASATASGKTEAFAAPAAELVLQSGGAPLTVLILSPTRALANDLKRRLESPMQRAGVTFGRHTGEHKEKVDGRFASVVVATPEALDSLLARRPSALRHLRMVVIDEIHVLDGTARGDQLRVLLHRLDNAADLRPRKVAVSATIEAPEKLAERYLRDPELVLVEGGREIRARAFEGRDISKMADHLNELAGAGARKILVFCNKRDDVEKYSLKLMRKTRFTDAVYAHHGSMSKIKRERTERQFQGASAAVCFATMTLEMGIDIGSVDYVLLAGVPSSVSSLLQRIGRGGRRGDATRFGYMPGDAAERHRVRTMARLGARGELCGAPYGFRYSVLAQQALTLAGEQSLRPAELRAAVPESLWPPADPPGSDEGLAGLDWATELLRSLVEADWMERRGRDAYVLTERAEQRFVRGTLHSNLDDDAGVEVVDRITGDTLGGVMEADARKMGLGGASREVVRNTDGRILTDAARGAEPAKFKPRGRAAVSFSLARATVEALGVPEGALALHPSDGAVRLLHGLGTAGSLVLARLLERSGVAIDRKSRGPFNLDVAGLKEGSLTIPEGIGAACLKADRKALEKMIGPGPWAKVTPDRWRAATVQAATGLDEVVAFLETARVVDFDGDEDQLSAAAAL